MGGVGIQLRQKSSDRYIHYKFPTNILGWKDDWFYIGNHTPALPEKSGKSPVPRKEWKERPNEFQMDQVDELLTLMIGVNSASVMFSFFQRCVQPLQERHNRGFEYLGTEDPSRICAEELSTDATMVRVKRILLDMHAVPYVPELFSAAKPPEPVSLNCLLVLQYLLPDLILWYLWCTRRTILLYTRARLPCPKCHAQII